MADNPINIDEQLEKQQQLKQLQQERLQQQKLLNETIQQRIDAMEQQKNQAKKLSYQISQVNQDLVDHAKLLVSSKLQYQKLSNVGKKFADSLDLKGVVKNMQYAMSTQGKLSGKLYGTYKSMSSLILTMSKNASNLGQQDYQDLSGAVSGLANELSRAAEQMQSMMTKDMLQQKAKQSMAIQDQVFSKQQQIRKLKQLGKKDIQEEIKSQRQIILSKKRQLKTLSQMGLQDNENYKTIQDQIKKIQLENIDRKYKSSQFTSTEIKQLEQQIKLKQKQQSTIQDQIKDARIVEDEQFNKHKREIQQLSVQLDIMKDQASAQQALNEAAKKYMQRLDKAGEYLDKGLGGLKGAFAAVNLELPGIQEGLDKISFSGMITPLKKLTSQTVTSFSQDWDKIKKSGHKSFKDIAKFGATQFKGLAKSLTSIMRMAFFGLVGIFITVMMAMFTAAWRRSQELQEAQLSAQQGAGALTGAQQPNFGALYNQLGGMQHGGAEKVQALYSNMDKLRNITSQTAAQVQVLDRQFGVSADTSAKALQNLRLMTGASEKTSGQVTKMVARFAVLNGMQPQKVVEQMASASGDALRHFGDSPQHLARTVMFAKRLGLTIDEMARSAEGFMDIEKTIATTMELQAITGKQIDVASLLQLTQSGRGDQATAMLLDTLGDSFDQMGPYMQQKLSEATGLSVESLRKVRQEMKITGKGAMESLTQISKQVQDSGQNAAKAFDGVGATHAAAYLTPMQEMGSQIQNILADAFSQPIAIIQGFLPKLIPLFKTIAHWMGDKLTIGLRWITDPKNQKSIIEFWKNKVVPALQTIWKTVKWLWDIAVKFVKWAGKAGAWIAKLFGGDQTIGKIVGMGIAIFALLNPVKTVSIAFSGLSKVFNLIFGTSRRKQAKLIADAVRESMGENQAAEATKNISSIFSGMGKKISSTWQTIRLKGMYAMDGIKSTWQTIKLKGMYAMDSIKSGWETVKIKGLYAMDGIKKAVTTAGSAISGTFKNIVSSLSGAFSGIKTKLGPFISNFGSNVGNAFKSAKASLMNFVSAQNLAILKTKALASAQKIQEGVQKLLQGGGSLLQKTTSGLGNALGSLGKSTTSIAPAAKAATTGMKAMAGGAKVAATGAMSMGGSMVGLLGAMVVPPMCFVTAAAAVIGGLLLLNKHLNDDRPIKKQKENIDNLNKSLSTQSGVLDSLTTYWDNLTTKYSNIINSQTSVQDKIKAAQQQGKQLKISDLSGTEQAQLLNAYNKENKTSLTFQQIKNDLASKYVLTLQQQNKIIQDQKKAQRQLVDLASKKSSIQASVKLGEQAKTITNAKIAGSGGTLGGGFLGSANQKAAAYMQQQTVEVSKLLEKASKTTDPKVQKDLAAKAVEQYADAIRTAGEKGLKAKTIEQLQTNLKDLSNSVTALYGVAPSANTINAQNASAKGLKQAGKDKGTRESNDTFAAILSLGIPLLIGPGTPVGDWIDQAEKDTRKWLSGAAKDTGQWISGAWKDTKDWVSKAAKDTGQWISNTAKNTGNWISNAWTNSSNWINTTWSSAKQKGTETWENVKNVAANKWQDIKSKASGVWDTIKTKGSGIWDTIKSTATGIWTEVSDFFSTSIPKFFTETLPSKLTSVIDIISEFINKHLFTLMRNVNKFGGVNNPLIDDTIITNLWTAAGGQKGTGVSKDNIIGLAEGGIITKPTVAIIGEGRQSEAVAPLSDMYKLIDQASNNKSTNINIDNSQTNTKLDTLISLFTQMLQSPTTINMNLDGNKVGSALIANSMKSSNLR